MSGFLQHYEIIRKLIDLREKLRPYIHEQMDITSKTGMPIMRPTFYAFPDDPECYTLDDQYMFGSDILFAPIMERGQTSRDVYLPEGRWVLTQDGTEYQGGRTVNVHADLDQFIAFVPVNSALVETMRQ